MIDRLVQGIQEGPVMAKLVAMARDLAGVALLVFVRNGERIDELCATGRPAILPEFCRIVRGSAEGRKRCAACRQLIAFGACYRGLSEFSCHGGVALIAAPGERGAFDPSESLVVTSCAFAHAVQEAHRHDLCVVSEREADQSRQATLEGSATNRV